MILHRETDGWTWKRWAGGMQALATTLNRAPHDDSVFLGDGTPCNWVLASTWYPRARQILNIYHAGRHITDLSRILYRQDDPKQAVLGDRWAARQLTSLKRYGPGPLLRALERRRPTSDIQFEALHKEIQFFKANAIYMQYPEHLAAGRTIESVPIDSAIWAQSHLI